MVSLGDEFDRHKGKGPGFDTVRLSLAVAILCVHSIAVGFGTSRFLYEGPYRGLVVSLLPAFFALSGFLVSGSVFRSASVPTFVAFRVVRILPALAVEIALSALILGPLVTSLPLREYFSDEKFFLYFANIVGMVQYVLPGVFEHNPQRFTVNVSLWTVPIEIYCYIFLVTLMAVGVVRHRMMMLAVFIGLSIMVFAYDSFHASINPLLPFPTRVLLLYFAAGIIVYMYRYRIPYSPALVAVAWLLGMALLFRTDTVYLSTPLIAYGIAGLGMMRLPRLPFADKGDYSYGVYLYHYPIQQTLVFLVPALAHPLILAPASLPVVLLFAAWSWHYVEKPALRHKASLKDFLERRSPFAARPSSPAPDAR